MLFLVLTLQFASPYLSGVTAATGYAHKHLQAVTSPLITHASGLAASRIHEGVLYTHNDANNPQPYVFALNATTSALIATLRIYPATNKDWEDIAVGPCGGKSCIYILDSQPHRHRVHTLYRVQEPEFLYSDQILLNASKLDFTFQNREDTPSDTVMVDPRGDAWVISTREGRIGRVRRDLWGHTNAVDIDTHQRVHIPHVHGDRSPIMAGDMSPDGRKIVMLIPNHVLIWDVHLKYNFAGALSGTDAQVINWGTYNREMEGICWDNHGENFYINQEGQNRYLIYFVRHH